MTVLVDTSVWAAHFRSHNATLVHLLLLDQVRIHPLVVGELACGTPPEPRVATLRHLEQLQPALQASPAEVREFIERERLFGLGCGLIMCRCWPPHASPRALRCGRWTSGLRRSLNALVWATALAYTEILISLHLPHPAP
jgi:hypothetical protein